MIDFVTLSVDTAASGSGSTTDTAARSGHLLAIGIDYHASIDAGADVVVSVANVAGPALTILTVTNNKTDGWYHPRAGAVSPANATITDSHVQIPFYGNIKIDVAQAGGALTGAVKVTIYYENGR